MSAKPYGLAVKAVILDREGRCLLIRRSAHNHNFVGKWEWPGGKTDPCETFDVALHREVAEETGLIVELAGFVGSTSFEMAKANVIILCMEAHHVSGDVKLSEEHDKFAWVPLAELEQWDLTEHVRPLMLDYAGRKSGAVLSSVAPVGGAAVL